MLLQDIDYNDSQRLDLYRIGEQGRPLVVCVHGGGFISGARNDERCSQAAELLLNAVEHGNLGISYAEKSRLLDANTWEQAVEDRLADPVFGHRTASVSVSRDGSAVTFVIRDQGEGFDWTDYLDFDPERAFDAHGRGIAMARQASFDEVEFLGNGNTVRARLNAGKVGLSD